MHLPVSFAYLVSEHDTEYNVEPVVQVGHILSRYKAMSQCPVCQSYMFILSIIRIQSVGGSAWNDFRTLAASWSVTERGDDSMLHEKAMRFAWDVLRDLCDFYFSVSVTSVEWWFTGRMAIILIRWCWHSPGSMDALTAKSWRLCRKTTKSPFWFRWVQTTLVFSCDR